MASNSRIVLETVVGIQGTDSTSMYGRWCRITTRHGQKALCNHGLFAARAASAELSSSVYSPRRTVSSGVFREHSNLGTTHRRLHSSSAIGIAISESSSMEYCTAQLIALKDEQSQALASLQINATGESPRSDEDNAVSSIMSMAEKAQDILIQMEDYSGVSDHYSSMKLIGNTSSVGELQHTRNEGLRPSALHYDCVISMFTNAASASLHCDRNGENIAQNSPYMAQRWLERMETLALEFDSGVQPTLESYHNAMKSYAFRSDEGQKPSRAAHHVQAIFDKLEQAAHVEPTSREYRLLLQTWASSSSWRDAAYEATGVWMTMIRHFRRGVDDAGMEPTLEDSKTVLEAWFRAE